MKKAVLPVALAASVCFTSLTAVAASQKDQIALREGVMEAIAGHFGAIRATMKGSEEMQQYWGFHADALAELAKISKASFAEGSAEGKTDAKAEIWEKPEDFARAMDTFIERADTFATAIKGDDMGATMSAMKDLGGSCKGCHDDFKKD